MATSLEELEDPANVYLQAQKNLFDANEELATQQEELTKKFNASGTELQTLGTRLKTFGLQALNAASDLGLAVNLGALDIVTGERVGQRLEARQKKNIALQKEQAKEQKKIITEQIAQVKTQGETLVELQNRIRGIRDQLSNTRPGDNATIVSLRDELVKAQLAATGLQKKLGLTKTKGSDVASVGLALLNKELAELNKQLLETDPTNLDDLSTVLTDIGTKEAEIKKTQIALRILKEEILEPLPIDDAAGQSLASALLDPIIQGAANLPDLQLQGQVAAIEGGQAPTDEGLERAAEIENLKQQEEDFQAFKQRMDEVDTEFKKEQQEIQLEDQTAFQEQREALVLGTWEVYLLPQVSF